MTTVAVKAEEAKLEVEAVIAKRIGPQKSSSPLERSVRALKREKTFGCFQEL